MNIFNFLLKLLFSLSIIVIFSTNIVSEDKFKGIGKLISEDKYDEAINKMQSLLPTTSEDDKAEILNAIGWVYIKSGDYSNAEKNILESHKLANKYNNTKVMKLTSNNLGILKYLQNKTEEAKEYFMKNRDSKTAKTYLQLIVEKNAERKYHNILEEGIAKSKQKDFEGAIKKYDEVLSINPKNAIALEYKGYALLRLDRPKEAIKLLETSKSLDPNGKFIYLNLVKTYCVLKDESQIEKTINNPFPGKEQFLEWYKVDNEFKRMCSENPFIASFQ